MKINFIWTDVSKTSFWLLFVPGNKNRYLFTADECERCSREESLYGGVDTLGRSWGREWRQVTQACYDNMVTKCDAKNLKIDVASARNAKDPFPVRKTQANKQTKNHLKAGYRCVTFSDNSHKLSLSFLAGKYSRTCSNSAKWRHYVKMAAAKVSYWDLLAWLLSQLSGLHWTHFL